MNQKNNEKYIIFVTTLSCVGLIAENYLLGWEFWVPPVILIGMVFIWFVNISERFDEDIRRICYFVFAALLLFYHCIHRESFFDAGIIVCFVMVVYSTFNSVYMMNIFLFEFAAILLIHALNLPGGAPVVYDRFNVSRLLINIMVVLFVYFNRTRTIQDSLEQEEERRINERRVEENNISMEDFLSNISHELRTPVNVVNGMSDLLIKRGAGNEADAIKSAGVRLAYQIEDIQDYTECKRDRVFLEEDNYMSTSLINDVVTGFRMNQNAGDLELVVDLDPCAPTMMRGDIRKLHKIFRHLLENAIKFTREGGIYVRMFTEKTDYGANLGIEMTDTGIGMDRFAIQAVNEGMYQANKKRNRSSGGIGLGLFIVYGFAHTMGGFVRIESEKNKGTTVRVTVPQQVVDETPCLSLSDAFDGAVLFHVRPDKYKIPKLREFYRNMASNLAKGFKIPLYAAETVYEVERLKEKLRISHIFMGQEEYEENRGYFEVLAKEDIVVAVSAGSEVRTPDNSSVVLMPRPLYAYPVIKILNDGLDARDAKVDEKTEKPVFRGVKALVVDDEPMNLVVAGSLFREYEMVVETAAGGKESIRKFRENDYDVIFMDHMMPEMDGVEAMKLIKSAAEDLGRNIIVVALTANAVSGAREMFLREGFDGFIAKPINTADFERVMLRLLSGSKMAGGGDAR